MSVRDLMTGNNSIWIEIAVFVLGGEPEGDTVAEQKLKFFWNDTEMTALRDTIRQQLGLEAFD